MYTQFILFGFVTSNGLSALKSSCKSPAQCPPPPHSLVPSTREVAMVRERDVPDGRLTSSNGSIWPPSHDQHSVPAESLHPSAPMARFFSVVFLSMSRIQPSPVLFKRPLSHHFFFPGFLTQKIFPAHFGPLVV